jgi:hypothetical protein
MQKKNIKKQIFLTKTNQMHKTQKQLKNTKIIPNKPSHMTLKSDQIQENKRHRHVGNQSLNNNQASNINDY